jgi:hypothetical protein
VFFCICDKLGKTNSILAVALASDGRSIIGAKHEILGDKDLLSTPSVRTRLHVYGVVGQKSPLVAVCAAGLSLAILWCTCTNLG